MTLTPNLSKALLTTHIAISVGWLGTISVFLVLAITALTTQDDQLAHASCIAMELSAWFVIVPFCLSSLFTGIVLAISTKWGLFKHYWIVVKLFLTVGSSVLLLLHLEPISQLAADSKNASFSISQQSGALINLIAKAGAAIFVLLIITTISIYKPWGKIAFKKNINSQPNMESKKKPLSFYLLIGLVSAILIFIIMHLLGGGMSGH